MTDLSAWLVEHGASLLALAAALRAAARARSLRDTAVAEAVQRVVEALDVERRRVAELEGSDRGCRSRVAELEAQVRALVAEMESLRAAIAAGGHARPGRDGGT